MSKPWFHINSAADVPVIFIEGYIGDDQKGTDYALFRNSFDEATKGKTRAKIKINSCGGSMTEGFAMYDHVKESGIKCEVQIVGIAASMAGIFAMVGDTITMSKNAALMIHKPKAGAYGESQSLRSIADFADKLEAKAKEIFKKKTGQSDDVVNSWLVPGVDKWFTSNEALANKLIDGIVNDDTAKIAASAMQFSNEREAWTVYNSIDLGFQNQNSNMKKITLSPALLAMLALTAESTDEQIELKLTQIANEHGTLKLTNQNLSAQATEASKARVKALIDSAINEKRITEAERVEFTAFAEANYDLAEKQLKKITPIAKLSDKLGNGGGTPPPAGNTDRSAWTFDDWASKDSAGLTAMQKTNPEQFKQLTDAKVAAVRAKGIVED